jgi:hypothetical protein
LSEDKQPESNLGDYAAAMPEGVATMLTLKGVVAVKAAEYMSKMKEYIVEHWHELTIAVVDLYTKCSSVAVLQWTAINEDDDVNVLTVKQADHENVCSTLKVGGLLVYLKASVTAYEDLGSVPDKRFQEDKDGKAIMEVIKTMEALDNVKFEPIEVFGHEHVNRIKERADEFIKCHGNFKITAALPNCTTAEEKLRQVACGTQTGDLWHKDGPQMY